MSIQQRQVRYLHPSETGSKVPPPLAGGGQGVGEIAMFAPVDSFTHPSIPSRHQK